MTKKTKETNDQEKNDQPPEMQFHVAPELAYVYHDLCNVHAGIGDVVLEFGNIHRAMPGHATISNRVVLSVSNAYQLTQTLQQALQQAQAALQHGLQQQEE